MREVAHQQRNTVASKPKVFCEYERVPLRIIRWMAVYGGMRPVNSLVELHRRYYLAGPA